MALINSGQIELLDLTDTRAAILTLNTSLPKLQVQQSDGNFSPDFEKSSGKVPEYDQGFPTGNNREAEPGLHIYPSLYFGQELISINNYSSLIEYTIEGVTGSFKYEQNSQNNDIYVNSFGELIYKKNLTEDNLIITAEIEEYDVGIEHYEDIIGRVELTKITPDSNYLPIITYNKNVFSSYDKDPIRLTASLYRGGECLTSGVMYNWRADSEAIKIEKAGVDNVVEISRDQIVNVATIFCDCIVTSLGKTYTTQVTISDTTDPLFSQIISSKGLVFTGSNDVTNLTCDIYRGTELINGTGSSFKYSWSYLQEGSTEFEPIVKDSTSKTIEVFPQQINANSVTYRCEASNGVEKTVSQIAIIISPEFKAIVNPVQSFINTKHDGSLTNEAEIEIDGEKKKGFTRTILFKVVDGKGTVLDINNVKIFPQIDLQTEEDNPFSLECKEEENKTWTINMTFVDISSEEEDYSFFAQRLTNATLFIIEYDYKNIIQLSEEFYLIKNIQGEQGINIINLQEEYALGTYENEWSITFTRVLGIEGVDALTEEKLDEQGNIIDGYFWRIFDAEGKLTFDSSNNITGRKQRVTAEDKTLWEEDVFCLNQDITKKQIPFFIQDSDWLDQAPFIEEGAAEEPKLQNIFYKKESSQIIEITPDYNFIFNSFALGNSLWVRNKTFWEDGSITYSEPLSNEQMKFLQITASKVDTIYTNDSIKQIVAEQNWYQNHIVEQSSEINQMKNAIELRVKNEDINRYFSFEETGLVIREKNSPFSTLTDDKGFHVRYSPNLNHNDGAKILGSFDNLGLNTTEISLAFENEQAGAVTIVSRGTPTKGWAWTKGQSRVKKA